MDKAPAPLAVVVSLVASMPAPALPAATDFELSPQGAQDEVQQWFDRYDCDSRARSAVAAAGAEGAGAARPAADERYVRAMVDCLAQHGYGARYAPPRPQPPATPASAAPEAQHIPRELRYRALSAQAGGGYTAASGSTSDYLQGGGAAGVAATWFPSQQLPLGVRVEGSYTWSKPAAGLLALNGVGYNRGEVDIFGGEADLRFNLGRLPVRWQLYLLAGAGWYRIDSSLQKVSEQRVCGGRYCSVFETVLAEAHDTSSWQPSWNAGLGWELALDSHTAFFIEARYRRILRESAVTQLVPVWLGLRF